MDNLDLEFKTKLNSSKLISGLLLQASFAIQLNTFKDDEEIFSAIKNQWAKKGLLVDDPKIIDIQRAILAIYTPDRMLLRASPELLQILNHAQ